MLLCVFDVVPNSVVWATAIAVVHANLFLCVRPGISPRLGYLPWPPVVLTVVLFCFPVLAFSFAGPSPAALSMLPPISVLLLPFYHVISRIVVLCFVLLCQADVGLAATIGAMDAANAVAVEWGLGVSTPGVLDEVWENVTAVLMDFSATRQCPPVPSATIRPDSCLHARVVYIIMRLRTARAIRTGVTV